MAADLKCMVYKTHDYRIQMGLGRLSRLINILSRFSYLLVFTYRHTIHIGLIGNIRFCVHNYVFFKIKL